MKRGYFSSLCFHLGAFVIVEDFYNEYKDEFCLTLIHGSKMKQRKIEEFHVERPGLKLAGFGKKTMRDRTLVFSGNELECLRSVAPIKAKDRLVQVLSDRIPMIVIANSLEPTRELIEVCELYGVSLFQTSLKGFEVVSKLTLTLFDHLSPTLSCHATLVEVFSMGALIQGSSSVGKSEAALGLIERGHRLVSDDVTMIKKTKGSHLQGRGLEIARHLLEIRGIGILNIADLYGAVSVSQTAMIDIVIKLETWDDEHFYDRVGLEEKFQNILGVQVPFYILPVKSGRDVTLLIETIVLNHRLKKMGYHSAKEFNRRLLSAIDQKSSCLGVSATK